MGQNPIQNAPPPTVNENVTSEYANNTFFAPNVWDLKILFGELEALQPTINWHTVITLPWAHVKLMSFYLGLNLAFYEERYGQIKLPESVIPLPPNPPTLDEHGNVAVGEQKVFDLITEHRQRLIDSLRRDEDK